MNPSYTFERLLWADSETTMVVLYHCLRILALVEWASFQKVSSVEQFTARLSVLLDCKQSCSNMKKYNSAGTNPATLNTSYISWFVNRIVCITPLHTYISQYQKSPIFRMLNHPCIFGMNIDHNSTFVSARDCIIIVLIMSVNRQNIQWKLIATC